MALYQLRSKAIQSQDIWHTSSLIKILTKGRDPNINIINSIHNIKGKTSVNILVSNYTNKHIMFNKGEYVGHLEPALEDNNIPFHDYTDAYSANSVTTQWMMAEHIEPDTFDLHATP